MFLKIALTLILTTIIIVSGRSLSTGKSILFQTVFIVRFCCCSKTKSFPFTFYIFSGWFTCEYEGSIYDELDVFNSGYQGCAWCICVERQIYCNKSKCHESTTERDIEFVTVVTNRPRNIHNGFKDIK